MLCCAKEGEVKRKRALCMGSLQEQAGTANANALCAIFFFHILFPYLKALLQIILCGVPAIEYTFSALFPYRYEIASMS